MILVPYLVISIQSVGDSVTGRGVYESLFWCGVAPKTVCLKRFSSVCVCVCVCVSVPAWMSDE